jgi:hypothetical protein
MQVIKWVGQVEEKGVGSIIVMAVIVVIVAVAAIGGYYLWTRHGSPTKPNIDILHARFAYSSGEFGFLAADRGNSPVTVSEVYLEESGKGGGYYHVSVTVQPLLTEWIIVDNLGFAPPDNVFGGEISVKLFDPTGKILYENSNLHFDWSYALED